jgi:uncharacterized membrane protein YuzA (DUF378 family)
MKDLGLITFVLLIIGGLNWLLVGLFGFDVGSIFGGQSALVSRIIYILVGVSAIYSIFSLFSCKKADNKVEMPETAAHTPSEPQM